MFAEMAEAKFFRILDTEGGFWQAPLDTEHFKICFQIIILQMLLPGIAFWNALCRKTSQTLGGLPGMKIHVNDTEKWAEPLLNIRNMWRTIKIARKSLLKLNNSKLSISNQ